MPMSLIRCRTLDRFPQVPGVVVNKYRTIIFEGNRPSIRSACFWIGGNLFVDCRVRIKEEHISLNNSHTKKETPLQSAALGANWIYRRGDIYMANLNSYRGSEQGGKRPVLVIQNDYGNYYSPTLIVATVTSVLKRPDLPVHCTFPHVNGLKKPSMFSMEQIKTIDKARIISYIGTLTKEQMDVIDHAICISLNISDVSVLRSGEKDIALHKTSSKAKNTEDYDGNQ